MTLIAGDHADKRKISTDLTTESSSRSLLFSETARSSYSGESNSNEDWQQIPSNLRCLAASFGARAAGLGAGHTNGVPLVFFALIGASVAGRGAECHHFSHHRAFAGRYVPTRRTDVGAVEAKLNAHLTATLFQAGRDTFQARFAAITAVSTAGLGNFLIYSFYQ